MDFFTPSTACKTIRYKGMYLHVYDYQYLNVFLLFHIVKLARIFAYSLIIKSQHEKILAKISFSHRMGILLSLCSVMYTLRQTWYRFRSGRGLTECDIKGEITSKLQS